jgi:hypothetical protein
MTFRLDLQKFLLACGVGVSVQFMVSSLETLIFGDVIQTASAEHGGRTCEAAKRRALEIAPELLSLADWPLDDHLPAECVGTPDGPVAVFDDALPEAVEIADVPSVVTVVATVSGEDALGANESSVQRPSANQHPHPLGRQLVALDTESLDQVRGGFEMEGSGLKFSIGIERAVFINGNLVATNVLNLKGLQSTAGGASAASALPAASSGALVVQNGATGNYVASQVSQNPAATVVQNSLSNQTIQTVTTINASVNSMQAMRAMSVQNAIQYGIVSSLRR